MKDKVSIPNDKQDAALARDRLPVNSFNERKTVFIPTLHCWELKAIRSTGPSQSQKLLTYVGNLCTLPGRGQYLPGPHVHERGGRADADHLDQKQSYFMEQLHTSIKAGCHGGHPALGPSGGYMRSPFLGPQLASMLMSMAPLFMSFFSASGNSLR